MYFSRHCVGFLVLSIMIMISFPCMVTSQEAQKNLPTYQIGIGDILNINTWKEPDLSFESVMVRVDGRITFPLLDDIQAAGLTTVELETVIEEKISNFVEAPSITVTLINPVSQKYYILGEVQKVGEYQLIKKLTAIQAFSLAGGFTEWASKKQIIVHRKTKNGTQVFKIDYTKIVKGDFSSDMLLKSDDIIIVP